MKTHRTYGEALADPTSSVVRFNREAQAVADARRSLFSRWIAEGLSAEECWTRYLALQRDAMRGA